MKKNLIEQALIMQHKISESRYAGELILNACHFLSLTMQPSKILLCTFSGELECIAQYTDSEPLHYNELSTIKFDESISLPTLWKLIDKPPVINTCFASNELKGKEAWVCFKLLCEEQSIYIFVQSPLLESLKIWESEPLLSSVLMQFAYKLGRFHLSWEYQVKMGERDLEISLHFQKLKVKKEFISGILKLQDITLSLGKCQTLDELNKLAVETLRDQLGFDRTCLFLIDGSSNHVNSTYGTDSDGNTTDENNSAYDRSKLVSEMLQATFDGKENLIVVEQAPLYTMHEVVGSGWNAMLILREREHVLGWVALDNLLNQKPLLEYQKKLLTAYGEMLSQAIVRKREEYNLKILHDCIIAMSEHESVSTLCRSSVQLAREYLKLDRVAIFLTDDNGATLKGTTGTDVNGNLTDESYYHEAAPRTRLVQIALAKPDFLAVKDPALLYHNGQIIGQGWNAVLQLRSHDKIIGLLVADNLLTKRPLTGHSKQLIHLFARNLAEILERKTAQETVYKLNEALEHKVELRTQELAETNERLEETNKQLEKLSFVDGLTGVGNRRYFDDELKKCWNKACRNHARLSIVMLDADNFKTYNDHYGHVAGDEVLKKVASILNNTFRRASELVARYGGEEFVVLISDSSAERIVELTNVALQNLFDANIEHQKSGLARVTLSAGISSVLVNQKLSKEALLDSADKMLYQAKDNGKNGLVYELLE